MPDAETSGNYSDGDGGPQLIGVGKAHKHACAFPVVRPNASSVSSFTFSLSIFLMSVLGMGFPPNVKSTSKRVHSKSESYGKGTLFPPMSAVG